VEEFWKKNNSIYVENVKDVTTTFDVVLDVIASDDKPLAYEETQARKVMGEIFLNPGGDYLIKETDEFILVADDSEVAEECLKITKFPEVKLDQKSPLLDFVPYHITKKETHSKGEEVDWKTRVIKSYDEKKLKDHIVLLGTWEENSEFLLKYESFQIKNPKPVVILQMDKPSSYLWGKIEHIPNVYIVFGSFTYLEDLYRAGVRTASNLIVFSSFDQKLVVLYRSLKGTDCFKIVDLVDVNTCQFLSSVRFTDNYTTTTSFASGNVYSSSQLDTMLSQSMNSDVNVVKLAENLLSSIFSIPVESIESKTNKKFKNYEDLFKILIEANLVPMGLYREYEPNRKKKDTLSPIQLIQQKYCQPILFM